MKLKTIELEGKTYAEVMDGKPVFIHDDGKEIPFDAAGTAATISRLNGEAKKHRERADELKEKVKAFEGIDDPEAARKALETVANLDAKKLVDAGEIEKVKAEAVKAFEEKLVGVEKKYAPIVKERDQFKIALENEKIGNSFTRSKLIADKLAIPADLVEARFRQAFKVEGSDVVAYDNDGNKLFSRSNPGEVAGFDEALDILIEKYPYRDHILKGARASGGGAFGAGNGSGGKRTITRAQYDALSPSEQAATAMNASKGEVAIVD